MPAARAVANVGKKSAVSRRRADVPGGNDALRASGRGRFAMPRRECGVLFFRFISVRPVRHSGKLKSRRHQVKPLPVELPIGRATRPRLARLRPGCMAGEVSLRSVRLPEADRRRVPSHYNMDKAFLDPSKLKFTSRVTADCGILEL